jgi:hypothetical protein
MADREPPGDNSKGAPDQSVAERNDLIERFLLGWRDSETGEYRHFKFGSREERTARSAIAYLLRNHAITYLRNPREFQIFNHLARLFDPSSLYALDIKLVSVVKAIPASV